MNHMQRMKTNPFFLIPEDLNIVMPKPGLSSIKISKVNNGYRNKNTLPMKFVFNFEPLNQ